MSFMYYCWPTFDSSLIAPGKSALTVVCHLIEVFCKLERFSDHLKEIKCMRSVLSHTNLCLYVTVYGGYNCCMSLGGFWEMEFSGNEDMCTPQGG